MPSAVAFFQKKKKWSEYKDLILDYYLKPYLAKVAHLGKPVAIIDCCAGPGIFGDGKHGSPLIIANHLSHLHSKGTKVTGMFIETVPKLFAQLDRNLSSCQFPVRTCQGDFLEFVPEIVELASTHTIFLYVDPFRPGQVKFGDLVTVYEKLRQGRSVETLMNFMSTGFVRRALGARGRVFNGGQLDTQHREILACDEIAGGDYWQKAVYDPDPGEGDPIESVARGYAEQLERWFNYVLSYPIREHYGDKQPKYHLIFGSGHPDAIDLMNGAMVKARREFVGAFFVDGMLFPNQPEQEVVEPVEVEELVINTAKRLGRTTWKNLRVRATLAKPCMYNDSEFNKGIKAAISSGKLGSTATGSKIENDADVWPPAV